MTINSNLSLTQSVRTRQKGFVSLFLPILLKQKQKQLLRCKGDFILNLEYDIGKTTRDQHQLKKKDMKNISKTLNQGEN